MCGEEVFEVRQLGRVGGDGVWESGWDGGFWSAIVDEKTMCRGQWRGGKAGWRRREGVFRWWTATGAREVTRQGVWV